MNKKLNNMKKYSDFIQNKIKIEIFENPNQYDKDIDFWYKQYEKVKINLEEIIKESNININNEFTEYVLEAKIVDKYFKIIEKQNI